MIKKAQIKFICITMTILLAVFSVIYLATNYIATEINNADLQRMLNDVEEDYFITNGTHLPPDSFAIKIEQGVDGTLITPYFGTNNISMDMANKIAENALSQPYLSGKIDNVYYHLRKVDSYSFVFAYDATENLQNMGGFYLNSLFILLAVYAILMVIVVLLSFKVFSPIKDSFAQQKQFISDASHELKTPLAVISANAEILTQGEHSQWADNIKEQTDRMSTLIADMLTLTKIDEGITRNKNEKFNLSQIVLGVALPFDPLAFENGKQLLTNIEQNIQYTGDLQGIKTITNILLDNAIKYSSPNGQIIITLKEKNGKPHLSVYNTGSNIPEQDSDKIFSRFYRGDNSRSRNSGGSGLGLSIAKSIATTNKWKISARSIIEESMTIEVVL